MRVSAWWPDAPVLQVVRILPDGTRIPVRGGYPLTTSTATRRNYVSNPSAEAGTNGYVPDAGTPTLTQLADAAAPAGSYVLRATVAGAGSNGVTVPTALTVTPAGRTMTVGFALRTSALATSLTVSIGWTDAGGGALTANSATLSADQRAAAVGQFGRNVVTVTPPTGAVTPTLKIISGGMPAGGTMDLDAIVFEIGTTTGDAFDGATLGGLWLGTAHLSASILSPVQTILDGEAPFDTPVIYQVSYPSIVGGRVTSDPATLDSGGTCWLSHPRLAGQPVPVDLREVPVLERDIQQGIFYPLDAERPVVVSSARRQAPSGELSFNANSFDERDTIRSLLSDGMPVLLRSPEIYGYGLGSWLSFGSLKEDRGGRLAYQDATLMTVAFVEVDAPAPDVD
jgi:hypothetical protein